MVSMLFFTEVVAAKGMVPLRRVLEELKALPPEQQERIGEDLCAAQQVEYPTYARVIRCQFDRAKVDGDLPTQLLRVALSMGELLAYVLRPEADTAFGLSRALWHTSGSLHDADRSIEIGLFAISNEPYEELQPRWEIENRPLLVEKDDFQQFVRLRPPSLSQVEQASRKFVSDYERQYPGQKPRKRDFIEAIMEVLPTCNKAAAQRAWKNYAPRSWKRPGSPPGPRTRRR
jgi:hypothetical protein